MIKIILTEQLSDKWFGRIENSDDGHGNEIDCLLPTPEEALKSLLNQLYVQNNNRKNN